MHLASELLPTECQGQPIWRVLDTQFDGARLMALWQARQKLSRPPTVTHLVAIAQLAPSPSEIKAELQKWATAGDETLIGELIAQWHGLLPGLHRFCLAQGQFQFTLCLGELQPMLVEQNFAADRICMANQLPWNRWTVKALARCCRRGTALVFSQANQKLLPELQQAGFLMTDDGCRYDPPWTIRRRQPRHGPVHASDCIVLGAGLSGASVASALARRGWQVEVLDSAASPAAGASGLPVGLLVPHVSSDDSPRSQLSRAGLRLARIDIERLLVRGRDWADPGVLERRLDRDLGLPPGWPAQDVGLSHPVQSEPAAWRADLEHADELWHPQALWVKPAALVRAWLSHPGITFRGLCTVTRLERSKSEFANSENNKHLWQLFGPDDQLLAQSSHVVIANAAGVNHLLTGMQETVPLPDLRAVAGCVNHGLRQPGDEASFPPYPVNGLGSLIPAVPTDQLSGGGVRTAWYAGATYEDSQRSEDSAGRSEQDNFRRLSRLLPSAARTLGPAFAPDTTQSWRGVRCVSPDRLPLVGALERGPNPGLWISAAMGSRGLNFSLLCAELLAAQLGGEPWPVPASLAKKIDAGRFERKASKPSSLSRQNQGHDSTETSGASTMGPKGSKTQ